MYAIAHQEKISPERKAQYLDLCNSFIHSVLAESKSLAYCSLEKSAIQVDEPGILAKLNSMRVDTHLKYLMLCAY